MPTKTTTESKGLIDELFAAGAHYAYAKSRRHPSTRASIFGAQGRTDIFDLEHTAAAIAKAALLLEKLGKDGKQIVIASSKHEARVAVREAAEKIGVQYVSGRWVGGTFSNFSLIKKRIEHLEKLIKDRDEGALGKYTKKERLMIDREIKRLEETFGGLRGLRSLPAALILVDPKHEKNAIAEAAMLRIPVIAVANSDCDVSKIMCPIPANDSNHTSISAILSKLTDAYAKGKKEAPAPVGTPAEVR